MSLLQHSISLQDQLLQYKAVLYKEADAKTRYFVYSFFIFGLVLAVFYNTWLFALAIGGCCLAAHSLCSILSPGSVLSRMVTSSVFAIFMLQFISQMHGMYEMHFFFFINITILIIYQDWRVLVPYVLIAAIHHAALFGLQLNGFEINQYFIAMDTISYTVIFFHLLLVLIMGIVCGWWSVVLEKRSAENFKNKLELEQQLKSVEKNIAFAQKISTGDLKADYVLTEGDKLGNSLLEMRTSLVDAAQKEEQERFLNVGLSEVNELLRKHADQLQELSYQVVAKVVKYMNLNQGGLFILKDDQQEPYLELEASYAYDRKKFFKKQIALGEGLTGMAVLEKDTVLLTDIPENYINITSGLGKANPRSIVIVPLKTSDHHVVGVMEFASFHIFLPHEIQFLEKLAESIAAAITTAKVNQRTSTLLQMSQQQAEELRSQEEEMRQNMEELEATQEEMRRKEIDMQGQLKAIDNTLATIEFSMEGVVLSANDRFLRTMGYSMGEIKGKHHSLFCEKDLVQSADYAKLWEDLNQGITITTDFKRIGKDGTLVWLSASYTPILDHNGYPYKVIKLATDITQEKLHNLDMQAQIDAVNKSNAVIEFTPEGNIIRTNHCFQELMGYSEQELAGRHHSMFLTREAKSSKAYQQHWSALQTGQLVIGEFERIDKTGKTVWIKGTYNPVFDLNNKVVKVVKIALDITAERLLMKQLQLQDHMQLREIA